MTEAAEPYTFDTFDEQEPDLSWVPDRDPIFTAEDIYNIFDKAAFIVLNTSGMPMRNCLAEAMNIIYREKKGLKI